MPADGSVTVPRPLPPRETARVHSATRNSARTAVSPVSTKVHRRLPEQGPDQPVNTEPVSGTAVSVTTSPSRKGPEQAPPQEIPPGALEIAPAPAPVLPTVTVCSIRAKCAVTLEPAATVTSHAPVPEHPEPDQPAKREPADGCALRVTTLPESNVAEQNSPQSIPAASLTRLPEPLPALLTESVSWGIAAKVALTVRPALIVTEQVPVPGQAPGLPLTCQPLKLECSAGVAVRVTVEPSLKVDAQVGPQSTPSGELVTAPSPDPSLETVSACCGSCSNSAVTLVSTSSWMSQGPVPAQDAGAPSTFQPRKFDRSSSAAVRVTSCPTANSAPQSASQSIPSGKLVTLPPPVPTKSTSRPLVGVDGL